MNANVGGIDRILRATAGIGLVVCAAWGGPVWAWVGLVPLATAVAAYCPAYPLLGISTCAVKR
jgi:hypothetical protein